MRLKTWPAVNGSRVGRIGAGLHSFAVRQYFQGFHLKCSGRCFSRWSNRGKLSHESKLAPSHSYLSYVLHPPTSPAITQYTTMPGTSWEALALAKREEILASIPNDWRLSQEIINRCKMPRNITPIMNNVLDDDATVCITNIGSLDLVRFMANRSLSAVQVIHAYLKRGAYAHQIVCSHIRKCITRIKIF